MSERKVIDIKIADIKIGQRLRKTYPDIESLAGNIAANGLLQPILLNEKLELAAGGRRIKAFELLKKDKIPAIVAPIENMLDAELDENAERCDFTVTEKVAIADMLQEKIGERRGKDNENQDDANCGNFPQSGIKTRDFLAKRVRLGSGKTYQHAKAAIENAIPDVIEAMDRNAISIYCAYTISKEKKNKQLSLLNDSINDPLSAAEDLKALAGKRRGAKRAKRFHIPTGPGTDPIYNIIRVAPDWWKEKQDDIEALPITDYCIPTAVIAVECPIEFVGAAIKALETWGFTYRSILTAFQPGVDRAGTDHHAFSQSRSWHICIGTMDPKVDGAHTNKICPALQTKDPQAALSSILADLWPDKADKRLDMSSTDPRKGWMIWKLDYATKEK